MTQIPTPDDDDTFELNHIECCALSDGVIKIEREKMFIALLAFSDSDWDLAKQIFIDFLELVNLPLSNWVEFKVEEREGYDTKLLESWLEELQTTQDEDEDTIYVPGERLYQFAYQIAFQEALRLSALPHSDKLFACGHSIKQHLDALHNVLILTRTKES